MSTLTMVALVTLTEFLFLPPICLAIALVTSASHRESIREIVSHALRAWVVLTGGIVAFMLVISYFFEWVLPG